ncbi:MAG: hypothetical protein JSW28_08690 [Thermoplasmata archaeon]|nr:MAG: hypothetical protein JSW28_08690 [Thermoplasmata archaeon]
MPELMEILKKILRSYEFNITMEYPQYFLAEKEGSSVGAGVLKDDTPPTITEIIDLMNEMPQDLDKLILATTQELSQDVEDFASQEGILLWDRKKIEEEVGRAVLSGFGETQAQDLLDAIKIETTSREVPQISLEPEPIHVKIEPKGLDKGGELIMKPTMTMSEVSEVSKKIVQGFRFDLELIPYFVFDYSCELVVEGQTSPQTSHGTIAVNGLTNSAESWDFDFETVGELETTHTKLEPRVDEDKAFETAKETSIALNTREIQTVDDRGAVTIYEKKKVRPKEGAIDIQRRGLIYLPVWCVEGSNGVMIINATTGKVVKEDIYREGNDIYPRTRSSGFSF